MNFLNRSEYFEMALSKDWLEKKERRMELKECSAEALHVAVNFMYGINVPEDFKEHGKLLHLAELFMMDNLKEVTEERLAKALTKSNYLESSQQAEMYSITSLITKCGNFVFEEIGDKVYWEEMGKLPKVMIAFGKRAIKGKEVIKKREDFASKELYGEYVMQNVKKGSVVRSRVREIESCEGLKVGDLVTVESKLWKSGMLKVIFGETGRKVTIFSYRVEILALS